MISQMVYLNCYYFVVSNLLFMLSWEIVEVIGLTVLVQVQKITHPL